MPPALSGSLNHVALFSNQIESLYSFYKDVLRLEFVCHQYDEAQAIRSHWFKMGEALLMIEKADGASPSGRHLLAFTISENEMDEWKKWITSKNISITKETQFSFYFSDPDGNSLALSTYKS